jgi:hypothetical protein
MAHQSYVPCPARSTSRSNSAQSVARRRRLGYDQTTEEFMARQQCNDRPTAQLGGQDKSRTSRPGRMGSFWRTLRYFARCANEPRSLLNSLSHCTSTTNGTSPNNVMNRDDELNIRLGRVRDRGRGSTRRAKPFMAQVLAAAERAGGLPRRSGRSARSSTFGRGRAASIAALRRVNDRTRHVVIKTRVVRHKAIVITSGYRVTRRRRATRGPQGFHLRPDGAG